MQLVYLLANVGYRSYARKFAAYNAAAMRDNSDIPAPPVCRQGEADIL